MKECIFNIANAIKKVYSGFQIHVEVKSLNMGDEYIVFGIKQEANVRVMIIMGYRRELSLYLGGIPIEMKVDGNGCIGIYIRRAFFFRDLITDETLLKSLWMDNEESLIFNGEESQKEFDPLLIKAGNMQSKRAK